MQAPALCACCISGCAQREVDQALRDLKEYQLYEALQRALTAVPAQLTFSLLCARSILRVTTLNALFAVTGNLTLTWGLSSASQLLTLGYCETLRRELQLRTSPPTPPPPGSGGPRGGRKAPPVLQWPPPPDAAAAGRERRPPPAAGRATPDDGGSSPQDTKP